MATSGSGTSADPWIVHDWSEFVTAVGTEQNDSYIELGNDIDAPVEMTSALTIKYPRQIDGKGYAINNAHATGASSFFIIEHRADINKDIQNIDFKNILHDSSAPFIEFKQRQASMYVRDCSFAGYFDNGYLFKSSTGQNGAWGLSVLGICLNLDVSNGDFHIIERYISSLSTDGFKWINGLIRYVNCTPSNQLFLKQSTENRANLSYSTLRLYLEDTETKLDIGAKINNCYIIGKGSGIIVPDCSGVSVVESTLPLETSLSNVYSLPTATMKDPQTLHDDYGFPAGVN